MQQSSIFNSLSCPLFIFCYPLLSFSHFSFNLFFLSIFIIQSSYFYLPPTIFSQGPSVLQDQINSIGGTDRQGRHSGGNSGTGGTDYLKRPGLKSLLWSTILRGPTKTAYSQGPEFSATPLLAGSWQEYWSLGSCSWAVAAQWHYFKMRRCGNCHVFPL